MDETLSPYEQAMNELDDPQFGPEEEVEKEEPITTDEHSLLYLGFLSDTVDIHGNKISLRTLKIGEELEVELLTHKYRPTVEAERAYATALVAAAIQSVNGRPLVEGLGPKSETLESRFQYILDNWYWETVRELYLGYSALAERAREAYEGVKKN